MEGRDGKQRKVVKMVVSDGFEEVLRESMTALKLGGLVLKEEQKAVLYAVTSKKQDVYVFYRRILKPIADFNLILQGRQIFFGYGLSAFKMILVKFSKFKRVFSASRLLPNNKRGWFRS